MSRREPAQALVPDGLRLELTSSLMMQPLKDRSVSLVPPELSDSYDEVLSSPPWAPWLIDSVAP
jgi:hypothetical protein